MVSQARQAAWDAGHQPYSLRARFRRADGEWRWLEVSSKPRLDDAGNFHRYVGLAVDRTDAVKAETALRESEERYRAVVESQAEMVCRFRADGTILFVNSAYARSRRAMADELIGQKLWEFIPNDDRVGVEAMLGRLTPLAPEARIEDRFRMTEGAGCCGPIAH